MYQSLFILAGALVCGFVVSWLLTAGMIRWAPRLGLIDHPSERKFHTRQVPKGGGLAIYVGFVATIALLAPDRLSEKNTATFLAVSLLIVLLGLIDDRYQLPWQFRIAVQTGAALAIIGWPPQSGWLPPLVAIVWIVGLINAFNMLDNMDALSAGVAAIAALSSTLLFVMPPERIGPALPYAGLLGATLGFLWFNRPPARVFMGDAGSTFLGFFFGVRTMQDVMGERATPAEWLVPICLLAVPWYDMTAVVLLRLSQRRSPFHADKQHLSHRLVDQGLGSKTAVGTIHLLALVSGAAALALARVSVNVVISLAAIVAIGWICVAIVDCWARRRLSANSQTRRQVSEK